MTDVLLLHAGIADSRMWAPQLEALRQAGHRPLAPDLPGFGDAPLEPGEVDYVAFAADQLDGHAAVVGCSFGGRIAFELAYARPDLVNRLVLIGASLSRWDWSDAAEDGFADEEEALIRDDLSGAAAQQARMWLAPGAADPVRQLVEAMTIRSYEHQLPLAGQVRQVWPERSAEFELTAISTPTLVVVGSEDLPDVREIGERLAGLIPDARLETIVGAGHLPSLEAPEALNRLLLDFLR